MTIVIITHCGLPNGPRKEYPFLHLRMATILTDGSIVDSCITNSFLIAVRWRMLTEHVFSGTPAEFLGQLPSSHPRTNRSRWWTWLDDKKGTQGAVWSRLWKSSPLPLVLASKARRQSWWLKNQQEEGNQASEKTLEKSQEKKKKHPVKNNTLVLTTLWPAANCCKWVYRPFPCCHHKAVKLWHRYVLHKPAMPRLLWEIHGHQGRVAREACLQWSWIWCTCQLAEQIKQDCG